MDLSRWGRVGVEAMVCWGVIAQSGILARCVWTKAAQQKFASPDAM